MHSARARFKLQLLVGGYAVCSLKNISCCFSMMEKRINCGDIDIYATDSDDLSEVESILTYQEYLALQASGARHAKGYTLRTSSGSSDEEPAPKHTKGKKKAKSRKRRRVAKAGSSNPPAGLSYRHAAQGKSNCSCRPFIILV